MIPSLDIFKGIVLLLLLVLLAMFSLPRSFQNSSLAAPALISPAPALTAKTQDQSCATFWPPQSPSHDQGLIEPDPHSCKHPRRSSVGQSLSQYLGSFLTNPISWFFFYYASYCFFQTIFFEIAKRPTLHDHDHDL